MGVLSNVVSLKGRISLTLGMPPISPLEVFGREAPPQAMASCFRRSQQV